jgi:membrane associated rhomboid family serine protease
MQPRRDKVHRERIFNVPLVILGIVGVLAAIQLICENIPPERFLDVLQHFAFVPGRFTFAFDPDRVSDAYNAIAKQDDLHAQAARFFLGDGRPLWWTPLTYAFLHGGWLHLGMNCLWLAAFGSAVARRFGTPRFLLFYAIAAVGGAFVHFLTHMTDLQPVIGASAAVSGTMAAAIRFVFQPGAPLGATLGFAQRMDDARAYRLPALPLREIFSNRPALSFLSFWFLANLLFGVAPETLGITDASVAWQAHIGGFLIGLFAFPWFDPPEAAMGRPVE